MVIIKHGDRTKGLYFKLMPLLFQCDCGCSYIATKDEYVSNEYPPGGGSTQCPECGLKISSKTLVAYEDFLKYYPKE